MPKTPRKELHGSHDRNDRGGEEDRQKGRLAAQWAKIPSITTNKQAAIDSEAKQKVIASEFMKQPTHDNFLAKVRDPTHNFASGPV
jgi:hypothetical protein